MSLVLVFKKKMSKFVRLLLGVFAEQKLSILSEFFAQKKKNSSRWPPRWNGIIHKKSKEQALKSTSNGEYYAGTTGNGKQIRILNSVKSSVTFEM